MFKESSLVKKKMGALCLDEEEKPEEAIEESRKDEAEPVKNQQAEYSYETLNNYSNYLCSSSDSESDDNVDITITESVKNIIRKIRRDFEVFSQIKEAPFFIPTTFLNHADRDKYVEERDQIRPKILPKNCVNAYNLFYSINQDICNSFKRKCFLKHSRPADLVCLKKEFSPELAFEEVLMPRPFFYSKSIDIKKKSKYINPDHTEWERCFDCSDKTEGACFIVEFCVIYPEDKVSTVIVSCASCGHSAETVLDRYTLVLLKKELMEFSMSLDIDIELDESHSHRFRAVLPLPDDMIDKPLDPTFAEGIMGITPLTCATPLNPSVFIRVRIKYCTNSGCVIGRLIHESQKEEELYPDYAEQFCHDKVFSCT